jgi:hypothetical protein
VERQAYDPPLPCFGLEQNRDNPACPVCPHRAACAELMGHLARRVPLHRAEFNFVPYTLHRYEHGDVYSLDPDAADLEHVYALCHEWVFEHRAPGRVGRQRDLVLARARQSGTSVKLFILANMTGWAQSRPDENFHARVLTTEHAVRQVKVFAAACQRQYGTFDIRSLDRMMGTEIAKQDFESLLLSSEITAGSWIIGYKLFRSGQITGQLYQSRELQLHPCWLALEPSYFHDVLSAHLERKQKEVPEVFRRHRWQVAHILGKLKTHPTQAVALFHMRQRVFPEAVTRVLALRGFQTDDFLADSATTFTDPVKVWIWLAAAIQHYECLNLVQGYPSLYDHRPG